MQQAVPRREIAKLSALIGVGSASLSVSLTQLTFALGPFFALQQFGDTALQTIGYYSGLLVSSYYLGRALGWPCVVWLSGYCGRKPLLSLALLGSVCITMLLGLSNQFWFAVLLRGVSGVTGVYSLLARAALKEVSAACIEHYSRIAQVVMWVATIGSLVGLGLGGLLFLTESTEIQHPFFLPALCVAVLELAMFIVSMTIEETYLPPLTKPLTEDSVPEQPKVHADNSVPSYLQATGNMYPLEDGTHRVMGSRHSPSVMQAELFEPTRPMSARPVSGFDPMRESLSTYRQADDDDELCDPEQQQEDQMPSRVDKHTHISFIEEDFHHTFSESVPAEAPEAPAELPPPQHESTKWLTITIKGLEAVGVSAVNESFLLFVIYSLQPSPQEATVCLLVGLLLGMCLHCALFNVLVTRISVLNLRFGTGVLTAVIAASMPGLCSLTQLELGLVLFAIVYSLWKACEFAQGTVTNLLASASVGIYDKASMEVAVEESSLLGKCVGSYLGPALFALSAGLTPFVAGLLSSALLLIACVFACKYKAPPNSL